MARQSITLTDANNTWLKKQVKGGEYASKSEVVNDALRTVRELKKIEWLRAKFIQSEKSGYSDKTPEEMLASFKEKARKNGKL